MSGARLVIVCLLSLWLSAPASAQEVEICPFLQPCTVSRPILVGRDTTVSVLWRGRALFDQIGAVGSDVGYFTLGDPASSEPLGIVRRPLMERVTGSADGRAIAFSFSETLTVPAEVSQRAAAQGARELSYIRQFGINGIAVTGVQTLRLSSPIPNAAPSIAEGSEVTASGLILRRLALRFEDGAAVASVARDKQLRALAHIDYDRAGLLEAVWEVATPATTRGAPQFRRLDNVRQYLGAGQQARLRSPSLPTDQPGLYLLRLRLVQPTLEQRDIVLRYQVSGTSMTDSERVPVMNAVAVQNVALGPKAEFQWRRVSGAHVYQLELYDQLPEESARESASPDTEPVQFASAPATGLIVKGSEARAGLSPSVLHQLRPAHTYYWRVVAVDASGAVLAASPLQSIQTEQ